MVTVFLASREAARVFRKVLHSHQQIMRASVPSQPLQNSMLSVSLNAVIPVCVQWYHTVVFKLHWLGE